MMQDGQTPLYIACAYGHRSVANVLLAKGADLTKATNVSGCKVEILLLILFITSLLPMFCMLPI